MRIDQLHLVFAAAVLATGISALLTSQPAWCSPTDAYSSAMDQGKQDEHRGDFAAALKSYQAALSSRPNDPVALVEAGWAAFKANDFDAARKLTTQGIAAAKEPDKKAAALYNLGRIQEQAGQKSDAQDSYRQSLQLRPNKIVDARLRALAGGTSGSTTGNTASIAPTGPYASLDAFCKTLKAGQRCYLATSDEDNAPVSAKGVKTPYVAVKGFSTGSADSKRLNIGVQLASGWFGFSSPNESLGSIATKELVIREVVPGTPLVFSRTIQSWAAGNDDSGDGRLTERCTEFLQICGLNAAKSPSCIAPLAVAGGTCAQDDRLATKWDWRLDETTSGSTLHLKTKGRITEVDGKAAIGDHSLAF